VSEFKRNLGKIPVVVDKMTAQAERELIRMYAASLKDIRAQMAQIYAKYSTAGSLTYADMAKYGRLESLLGEINAQLKGLTGKVGKDIKGLQADVYSEAYYRTAFAYELEAQAKLRYVLLNPKTIEASVQNPISGLTLNRRLQKQRADIIVKARAEITQGLIKGEGYDKVARRLKGVLEDDLVKSRRIVQTESHRNHMQGKLDADNHAADAGVKVSKIWVSTLDDSTREDHQDMDGQEADEDSMFHIGGDSALAPGMFGVPEQDINCRCTYIEVIKGYEPSIRGVRDEGNIPYQTYKEWAEAKGI